MDAPVLAADQAYDIIFCRNLLIYQHTQAREHIVAALERLLKPAGVLFVGHAEMIPLLARRFEPVRHRGAFAYCKITTRPCHASPESVAANSCSRGREPVAAGGNHALTGAATVNQDNAPRLRGYLPKWRDARSRPTTSNAGTQLAEAVISPLPSPESRLDCVRVLADQGQLDKAAAMCRDFLTKNPQRAEAHFLMGIIREAEGQMETAEECFRRALYLDADCYDALIHLSLLKARHGDEAAAERLRAHAERVRDRNKVTT
jgi:chemotaxis protein methyltransferase WspC